MRSGSSGSGSGSATVVGRSSRKWYDLNFASVADTIHHCHPLLHARPRHRQSQEGPGTGRPAPAGGRGTADAGRFPRRFPGGRRRRHLRRQRPAEGCRLCPATRPVGAGRRQRACWSTPWAVGRACFPPDIPAPTPPTSRTTACCWSNWATSRWNERTARFVCHIAVADPSGEIQAESEAACRGRILFGPAAMTASATIRCSRSSSTTARLPSWG